MYGLMNSFIKQHSVQVRAVGVDRVEITHQGNAQRFTYAVGETRQLETGEEGDVLMYLLSNAGVLLYDTFLAWRRDTGLSVQEYYAALTESARLRSLLGVETFSLFRARYHEQNEEIARRELSKALHLPRKEQSHGKYGPDTNIA